MSHHECALATSVIGLRPIAGHRSLRYDHDRVGQDF
jgi:hypothetical protein